MCKLNKPAVPLIDGKKWGVLEFMYNLTLGLIVAGALLASNAVNAGQPNPASASASAESNATRAEFADLSGLPERDCRACFLLDAFGGVMPIPARYVVSTSFTKSERCLNFVAPHGPLLRPLELDAATLKTRSGTINYCLPRDLDDDVAKLMRKRSPNRTLRSGVVTISVWEPDQGGTEPRFWHAYFRSETEALWLSDTNPSLWKEMLRVLERTRE